MSAPKIPLPLKIGALLFIGIVIILFSGYLSYKSISSAVTMMYKDNAPHYGLATIKDINASIEKSENNIRLFGLTKNNSYLRNYKYLNGLIDIKIDSLRRQYPNNEWFSSKIDTIEFLIGSKNQIWNEMVTIWRQDTVQYAISRLNREMHTVKIDSIETIDFNSITTDTIGLIALRQKDTEEPANSDSAKKIGFFQKLFGIDKKLERDPSSPQMHQNHIPVQPQKQIVINNNDQQQQRQEDKTQQILQKLINIEKTEKETGRQLQIKETELTQSTNLLNEALLSLMEQLETYEKKNNEQRYIRAGELANNTYKQLAVFTLSGVLLSILVLFLVIKNVKKNRDYNNALIRSRQETENLVKAKELFMANVSHEIRTPLNAITGFIGQILQQPLDNKVREKMVIVNSASNQLIHLINDILDFSKLQAGKLSLNPVHFNPNETIERVCTLFSELAAKNNTVITVQVLNIEKLALYGDQQRLQQILNNLLSNAVKFTQNGTVEVIAKITPYDGKKVSMELLVKDTGIGIESSKIDEIFKDFTQANQQIAIKYGGTGMGLSIVKKLAGLFNGTVTLQSKKGQGTTVICHLVFKIGTASEIIENSGTENHIKVPAGLKFLIADDDEYNRMLISSIIEKWGMEFNLATNGKEVVEFLQKNKYDIVLMDLRMPEIDGIMATKFIRETLNLTKKALPVFGITAEISDHIPVEYKNYFNNILLKPFTEEELLATIAKETGLAKVGKRSSTLNPKIKYNGAGNLSNLLRTAGNDLKFVEEMVIQFINTTQKTLTELETAINSQQFTNIKNLAHKIAPACRHLELIALLKNLKEIETAADKRDTEVINTLFAHAKHNFLLAQNMLNEQLAQLN